MHKTLHLHPHKHTGKVLHHKHTSYHALALILVLAGLFMVSMNSVAKAADFMVTATVPAPLPAEPAVFTEPADGSTFYTSTVVVGGTCPVISPAIIVTVYEGSTLLGSRSCNAAGTFSLPIAFGSVGTHTIVATIMNFTGQTGATSTPLTLTYDIPTTPLQAQPSSTTPHGRTSYPVITDDEALARPNEPLDITSTNPFVVFGPTKDAIWNGSFHGGTTPYTVQVDWGDGSRQRYTVENDSVQSFRHHYEGLRTFSIKIQLNDAAGHSLIRVYTATTPAIFSAYPTSPVTDTPYFSWTWKLYFTYLLLVLSLLALWQRERTSRAHALVRVPIVIKTRPLPTKKRR